MPSWFDIPDWMLEAALKGVRYHLSDPEADERASHEAWCKGLEEQGWKVGPKKDPYKKEHPCLIPFDQLLPFQKAKDALFASIVKALKPYMVEAKKLETIPVVEQSVPAEVVQEVKV